MRHRSGAEWAELNACQNLVNVHDVSCLLKGLVQKTIQLQLPGFLHARLEIDSI